MTDLKKILTKKCDYLIKIRQICNIIMISKAYIFFLAFILILSSCEESVNIASNTDNISSLVIECELSPTKRIEAKVYTMSDFSKLDAVEYPKELSIELETGTDVVYFFKYEEKTGLYYIDPIQYNSNLDQSYDYTIKAYYKSDPENNLKAETKIPARQVLNLSNDKKVIIKDIVDAKGLEQKMISLPLTVSQMDKDKSFYRLKVYRKIYKTINDVSVYTGKNEELKFLGNEELPIAFTTSAFDGCLLFDASRLESKKLDLNFSTQRFAEGDKLNTLFYELESLTEPVFRYNIVKSKQIKALQHGLSDPVINYTNIIGGKGFFGSSNMTSDSIVISK
jgi:hypothetical protein